MNLEEVVLSETLRITIKHYSNTYKAGKGTI